MSLCRGEEKRRMRAERLLSRTLEKSGGGGGGGGGVDDGGRKEGGREIVTPRRRVQRQGNERLPALHHAQGLPQSAGGRGEMPHVSALLAPSSAPCIWDCLRATRGRKGKTKGVPISHRIFTFLQKKKTPHCSPAVCWFF